MKDLLDMAMELMDLPLTENEKDLRRDKKATQFYNEWDKATRKDKKKKKKKGERRVFK